MSLFAPVAWLGAYAVIVWSNASDIATDRYGLPPIGMATLLLLALLLAVRTARGQEDLSSATRLAPAAVLYLLVACLSLFWVQAPDATADRLSNLARNLLIGLVFVAYVTSMSRLRTIAIVIAFTLAVIAALGVVQYVTQTFERSYLGLASASIKQIVGSTDAWRITGPLGDANFFGQILIVGLPMTAAIAVASRQPAMKLAAGAGCVAILAAIILTFSRGTLFAVVVVATAFLMTLRRRRVYAGAVAVGLAVAMTATPDLYVERLLQVEQAAWAVLTNEQWIDDPALAQRLSVLSASVEMFRAHPLFGIGLGQFPVEYGDYALRNGLDPGAPNKAHSVYLGTLAEEGLVGFALLAGTITAAWATCTASRRRLVAAGRSRDAIHLLGLQLGFLGYLTTALFLHNDYARYFWILVALLLSTASAVRQPPDAAASPPHSIRRTSLNTAWGSPASFVAALWRRKALIALFALAGLLAGGAHVSYAPQRYMAETTLLYRFGREYFPVVPGEVRRNWGENVQVSLDAAVFTEMQLLNAHALFAKSLEAAGPDPATTGATPLPAQIKAVAAAFQVRRVQGAAMVTISAQDRTPARADRLLKAQVQGYLDQRRRIFDADAVAFYDARIAAALQEQADLFAQKAAARKTAAPDAGNALPATLRIDAQIDAVTENLKRLRQERGDAVLSQGYRNEVAKVIETVDWRSAEGNPVGLGATARLVLATLLGLGLGVIVALTLGMKRSDAPEGR